MALFNTYSSANREVTQPLDTSWEENVVTKLMAIGSGNFAWFTWIEYIRTRTKEYRYFGMNLATAKLCAAAMHLKYQRQILPQIWIKDGRASDWGHKAQPTTNDYKKLKCADIQIEHEGGSNYAVSVSVNEKLTYRHTATVISSADTDEYQYPSPARYLAFEGAPESSSYDNSFTGRLTLDYDEV